MKLSVLIFSSLLCFAVHAETTTSLEKDSDEAIMAAAEKLVAEGGRLKTEDVTSDDGDKKTEAAATTSAANSKTVTADEISEDMKREAQMPVFSKSEKLAKSESSLIWRMVGSLALIAIVGGVLIFAGRRWTAQKNKGGEKARIEILHQFHMGPKKSIALIRVAGEAMLLGCTDHSINFLKSITLVDEELEGIFGKKDFNDFLEDDEFSINNVRAALNSRA